MSAASASRYLAATEPSPALPNYREALESILREVEALGGEKVPLAKAAGRTLAETLAADRDLPPLDRATMDGYALRHAEAVVGGPMPVVAEIHAGQRFDGQVPAGACVAIATGAPVPAGLDTVVEHERAMDRPERRDSKSLRQGAGSTRRSNAKPGAVGPKEVRFASLPKPGSSIHRRATDACAGREMLPAGSVLTPQHLAIAAAIGASAPLVARRPRVAILTSGDEVVPVGRQPLPHQIRNSNGAMLEALVACFGGEVSLRRHVRDRAGEAQLSLLRAAASSDVVVTVGGISAGQRDPFVAALAALRTTFLVRGAALQPGGPITAARFAARRKPGATKRSPGARATPASTSALLLGLPGNPVSALVCAHLFLWPLLRRMLGALGPPGGPWRLARLEEPANRHPRRTAFRPARCVDSAAGAVAVAPWSGSGDLASTAATDGVVEIHPGEDEVAAGTVTPFLPWAWRT